MTIKLGYSDGSKKTELEVIRCRTGVESERTRIADGKESWVGLSGSETLVLRQVPADEPLILVGGDVRHGPLDSETGLMRGSAELQEMVKGREGANAQLRARVTQLEADLANERAHSADLVAEINRLQVELNASAVDDDDSDM